MTTFAVELIGYAADTAAWIAAGRPVVSAEVRARRRAICEACPFRTPEDACAKCGCPLHATALGDKLERATSACPDGRWPAEL